MSVIPLRPGYEPTRTLPVCAELIAQLEKMLEQARSGEIVGMAYASLHRDDLTTYGSAGRTTRGVLGAMMLLQHDMCRADIEDA